jgi:hypothetical protein
MASSECQSLQRPRSARRAGGALMRSALGGAACVCLLAVFASTALGATYNVSTTTDTAGTCGPAPVSCTLRQAINTVNATPNPPDVIDVQAGHYVLTLGTSLAITNNMTIAGAGSGSGSGATTVDANGAIGVFTVDSVPLNHLTLTGMNVINGNSGPDDGGGIFFSPTPTAVLDLTNVAFTGDSAGPGQSGGAIWVEANGADVLNVTNSTISADSVSAGGVGAGIGMADNTGVVNIDHSTVSGDSAGSGQGGGVYLDGAALAITNSTFSGNSAAAGGGIYITFPASSTTTLTNDTIAGNSLTPAGVSTGAGIAGASSVTAINTIVSGNTGAATTLTNDCDAAVHSSNHSLEFGTGCGFDLASGDPILERLANYGGSVLTMALGAGSAALNAGDTTACPATDERSFPRPDVAGTACDVGAYESGGPPSASIVAPANGAVFVVGQVVPASYSCTAGTDGILSVTNANCLAPLAAGAAIDTSTAGPHTFSVLAADADGQAGSATSTYTVVVAKPVDIAAPAITGSAKAGATLSCSTGTWANGPTSFAYQWSRNRTPIAGATSHTYKVQNSDEQLTITCTVTAANAAGAGTPATSKGVTIPVPFVKGCPRATGKLGGTTLGLVTLGMTRAQARHAYNHSSDRRKQFEDFFCLTPIGVRVGYGSPKLLDTLPTGKRRHLSNRVIWASTSSGFYAIHGIRPGATIAAARAVLKLTGPIVIGLNDWYLAPNGSSTAVLKVRHGIIEEIGIGDRRLTQGHKAQHAFLSSFF